LPFLYRRHLAGILTAYIPGARTVGSARHRPLQRFSRMAACTGDRAPDAAQGEARRILEWIPRRGAVTRTSHFYRQRLARRPVRRELGIPFQDRLRLPRSCVHKLLLFRSGQRFHTTELAPLPERLLSLFTCHPLSPLPARAFKWRDSSTEAARRTASLFSRRGSPRPPRRFGPP